MKKQIITVVLALSVIATTAVNAYADTSTQQSSYETSATSITQVQQQQDPYIQQLKLYMKNGAVWGPDAKKFDTVAKQMFLEAKQNPSSWAMQQIAVAIANGQVPSQLQGNYQQAITREELMELFVTTIFAEFNRQQDWVGDRAKEAWTHKQVTVEFFNQQVTKTDFRSFSDTKNPYVEAAIKLGITKGVSADKFNPSGKLTREEMAVIMQNYGQRSMLSTSSSNWMNLWSSVKKMDKLNVDFFNL